MQISLHEIKRGLSSVRSVLNLEVAYKQKIFIGENTYEEENKAIFIWEWGRTFTTREMYKSA